MRWTLIWMIGVMWLAIRAATTGEVLEGAETGAVVEKLGMAGGLTADSTVMICILVLVGGASDDPRSRMGIEHTAFQLARLLLHFVAGCFQSSYSDRAPLISRARCLWTGAVPCKHSNCKPALTPSSLLWIDSRYLASNPENFPRWSIIVSFAFAGIAR